MTTESPESTEQRCGHGRLWTDGQHYDPPLGMFAGWRPCDSPPSPSDAPSDEALATAGASSSWQEMDDPYRRLPAAAPPRSAHQHEAWQIQDGASGPYCAACGEKVPSAAPPSDEALDEYDRLMLKSDLTPEMRARVERRIAAQAEHHAQCTGRHDIAGGVEWCLLGILDDTFNEHRAEFKSARRRSDRPATAPPSDEARCTGSPTGKHTPDRMCRYCGLCGLPAEPSAATPVVEPDALVAALRGLVSADNSVTEAAAAALVALRGERDEARRMAEVYCDKAFAYEGEAVDLAASLDRVRAEVTWLADLVRAHRTVVGIFAQRVILHEIVSAITVAAALSPGEPPKEGNGHD